ncbi:hypothetical protein PV08_10904 [Exophiala spinifera]|uniref:Uncharacterized protein n=1 Tax=Exophiala spinifera TaxID=91928 RepID=A0A0D2AY24_9EURO|nr:uncharacterized protein PV08_10904 [Exophiala spinifera]KIW11603.1 hypothetical protein PV08_10904 [Exophiala spinifera]
MFDFLDTLDRGLPSERRGYPTRPVSLPTSRTNSTTSISSLRSEPAKAKSSGGGFGHFFKSKKDKKDGGDKVVVLTSQHAAAVRAKLARDPKFDKYRKSDKNHKVAGPRVVGSQNSLHLTAEQQELRHPHSGPPALSPPGDKCDLPVLARVISGDEVDEPDQWERMRDEWKQSKIPDVHMLQVIEGQGLESGSSSGTTTPREVYAAEVCLRDDHFKLLDAMKSATERPRPQRRITPIGSRYTKDERGVWKK